MLKAQIAIHERIDVKFAKKTKYFYIIVFIIGLLNIRILLQKSIINLKKLLNIFDTKIKVIDIF